MFFKTHIRWVKIFTDSEFETDFIEGKVRPLRKEGFDLLCVKFDESLKIFEKLCPHQKASLDGAVCEEGTIICPWHKYAFDLKTGKDISTAGNALKIFSVKHEDGNWFVGEEVKVPFWMDPA